jgi:hypothetical protein
LLHIYDYYVYRT